MPTRSTLARLLAGAPATYRGDAETLVSGIAYDSRRVEPGDVFVAVPGHVHDGLGFVRDALEAGAVAVVAEASPEAAGIDAARRDAPAHASETEGAESASFGAWAQVPDARRALAPMAARLYGNPSHELTVVGVTGTNGKTTVTALLESLLGHRGPVGRWSTTTAKIAGVPYPAHRTTPEGPDLQRILRRMVDAGCRAAAIEVSSHALALRRVDATRFAAAVFTNLSNDHLDFHADLEDYLDAKALLFEGLEENGLAVLNVDEPAAAALARRTPARVVGFGWKNPSARPAGSSPGNGEAAAALDVPTYWIASWKPGEAGSKLRLETPSGPLEVVSPLFGPANAENLAAGITTAMELGCPAGEVGSRVAAFAGPRGRFQPIDAGQPFNVLVDFAHTPAALQAAIDAARALAGTHRVITVFGCGGDRDRDKRPAMGAIAAACSDEVVLTSDNPRGEDPESILDEIEAGIPVDAGARIRRFVDRREAIHAALETARHGDCVLIAGKGHESEQIFADRAVPFDDGQVAREWLEQPSVGSRTGRQDVR